MLILCLDKPNEGDISELFKQDCEIIGLEFDLNFVKSAGADQFRKIKKTSSTKIKKTSSTKIPKRIATCTYQGTKRRI
jgi:hypothetical protein